MGLPACQERILSGIENALRQGEPHLVSRFAIFTRLNADEPVGAEPLARSPRRHRWLQHGTALYAFVVVPVMFTMIIIGALLSSRVHSVGGCAGSYSTGTGPPWVSRPWCQLTGTAKASASRTSLASCAARIPAIRFITRSGGEAFTPPELAEATVAGPPAGC